MTNKQQIQKIIDSIDITPNRSVLLNGKQWGEAFSDPYASQPSTKMLFQTVQQLIYSVYYTGAGLPVNDIVYPQPHEVMSFLRQLSNYNSNTEQFDSGWYIEQIDMQGVITAKKGNYRRIVHAGEFLNESSFNQKPFANAALKLYARKDHMAAQSGFYYMFGRTIAEDVNELLVRLYFNISPEGAAKLIEAVSGQLNKYNISFSFKCLQHPVLYTRTDAAVLYFDKRYSHIVFRLLPEIHAAIKSFLKPGTPMFSKKIANGIGFAENPFNPEESFGTHTSKMITQAIMHCYNNNSQKQYWLSEVINNIEQRHGYKDVERLFINPGSAYPYKFPAL